MKKFALIFVVISSSALAQAAPTPDEIHAEVEKCGQAKARTGHFAPADPWPKGWDYCADVINAWEKVGAKWHEDQKKKREEMLDETTAGRALAERLKGR